MGANATNKTTTSANENNTKYKSPTAPPAFNNSAPGRERFYKSIKFDSSGDLQRASEIDERMIREKYDQDSELVDLEREILTGEDEEKKDVSGSLAVRGGGAQPPSRLGNTAAGKMVTRTEQREAKEMTGNNNNNNNNNNETDMNMEVLKLRMEQLRLRETETTPLRVLVLDASLPKQRLGLNFGTQGDAKRSLNCGTSMGEGDIPLGTKFAMLGMSPTNKKVLPCGVEVEVTQFEVNEDGSTFVELTGTKRFKIDEQGPYLDEEEIPHVRVRFIDDDKACGSLDDYIPRPGTDSFAMMESLRELVDNEEALHELSTDLDDLLEKWERLVVEGKREQQPNHLELIKSHLGEFPDVKSFAKRAVWVCSYINPIPSLGVAYEIRPALLMAPTVGDMLRIAKAGLELSITKMSNEDKNIGPQID